MISRDGVGACNATRHPASLSRSFARRWLVTSGLFLLATLTAVPVAAQPLVSLIIDDLGDRWLPGLRAVMLPGSLMYAVLPHTPYSRQIAELAHQRDKEVMLHLPMEAMDTNRPLGPGGLTLDMTEAQFLQTLRGDLAAIPHVVGINNHMGSLLTRHPGHMGWLMNELRRRGDLFFVDSRTTSATVGMQIAHEVGVPSLERDVFLDSDPQLSAIREQFDHLLNLARRNGKAIGIGHPYPETLTVLEERLPTLSDEGVRLIPVSQLIKYEPEGSRLWQAYLSH